MESCEILKLKGFYRLSSSVFVKFPVVKDVFVSVCVFVCVSVCVCVCVNLQSIASQYISKM